jgi:hypothetical protein
MLSTNVLLVDDEVPFVDTMTKRLSKRNLTILTAYTFSNGTAGLTCDCDHAASRELPKRSTPGRSFRQLRTRTKSPT